MKKLILLLLISLPSIVFAQQLSYNWSTGDTTANISPTPLVTTTYYVTVTQYGVAYFDSVTVVVNTPDFVTDNQVACDSFYWAPSDTTFYNSLVFIDTLTNSASCDSVVTLNLTINNSNIGTDIQIACDAYTWMDGITYTASTSSPTFTLTNALGCDSVVTLNLTINNSNTGTDIQTACDSYTWIDGITYTSSTSAPTFTLTNASGCDSVVTLNLTINNSNTGTDIQTACDTYTWIDGVTYTASINTPTFTLTNAMGCDSVVTLNLTINNLNTGTDIQTACDTYTWIDGVTYTASTSSPTFTLTNAAGCDSVVTLNLTINNSNTGTDIQTACDTYTWIDGVTYTASTSSPTFTLTNAAGCDSVVTLNLTINNSSTGTDIQTACDSYTWIDGVTYTASTSTPTFTLTNAAGCDSVVTLNLTINNSSTGTDVQTACDSYTWIDGVTYTTSTSTPTFTLTNAAGCDSVVTLDLTINNSNTGTDIQTACDTYTWIDGVTYTASTSTPTFTLTNASGCDSVVTLDLTISNSNTGTDIQTACDTYTWIDGVTYTASTSTPTFTLTNAAGCDSVVTLNLTINYSNTGTDIQTTCDTYTWIDGVTYTASTSSPTFTLTNAAGCDSVVTLNLTINNSNTATDIQTACDTYTWIDGVTYTASTSTPTFTLTNASGCDSVVTLDLTINYSNTGTDIQTACDTYTWIDGVTYTASTSSPTFTLTNAAGCDSVVTLNLTINNSNTGTDIQIACDAYTWMDGITYTASTSSPTFTLTNAAGCDSVVTLNLTLNNSVLTQIDTLSVEQYTWALNSNTYTTSGIYYDTLTTTTGCDSIVELTLTIVPPLNLDVCATDTAICIGSTISLSVTVNQAVANPAQLEVGYYYEGGIIAYIFQPTDLGYVAGETHGVIIAENDIETKLTWGPWFTPSIQQVLFSTLSNEIGTGVLNTQRILFVSDSLGINYPAAEAATNYSSGCFNDWILPSEFDLLQIRSNVALNGLGNFTTTPLPSQFETGYWSSSFMSNFAGAVAPFMNSSGGSCGCAVFESYWVRPVRYF